MILVQVRPRRMIRGLAYEHISQADLTIDELYNAPSTFSMLRQRGIPLQKLQLISSKAQSYPKEALFTVRSSVVVREKDP